jgi:hypothetical protein
VSAFDPFADIRLLQTHPMGLINVALRYPPMPTAKDRAERRDRHSADVEASQAALRVSIDETERLVEESEEMLRRHRREHEAGDAARED